MTGLQLSNGGLTLVDPDVLEAMSRWAWRRAENGYAVRTAWHRKVLLHREITDCPEGLEVDHINGDKLDNRRANLRIVTRAENERNKPIGRRNTSGFKGVCFDKSRGKWRAATKHAGKNVLIGRFDSAEAASAAYVAWVSENVPEIPYRLGQAILTAIASNPTGESNARAA